MENSGGISDCLPEEEIADLESEKDVVIHKNGPGGKARRPEEM